ncbi:NAD(P)/FAD-dependent oxidoreductase [Gordonia sp. X0973]|uniref:phytoene desaturase family protein n=1 Tax=Gordonia sp. X0973 TaxID=2742602 RepID=UPI000F54967E|nr:NAD(P)/FAD-dependent oxidoreductase [Gordonia sp. X0973]QKT08690.1 NAD(P)/FAD-dependent oxidoreductase [Gordonia sp. X0973]
MDHPGATNVAWDAVVVGSGPNGLTAAAMLARAGRRVLVVEAASTVGGGMRSAELFEPGVVHDLCSAVHPLGRVSPAFAELGLADHGLRWLTPEVSLTHVFDARSSVALHRDGAAGAEELGIDAAAWRRLVAVDEKHLTTLISQVLRPLGLPRHPWPMARFGARALRSVDRFTRAFDDHRTRTLFAGAAAHAMVEMSAAGSAGPGLLLLAPSSTTGWPIARGGSQAIADALVSCLREAGGEIETGRRITAFDELPPAHQYYFDTSVTSLLDVLGARLPSRVARAYRRWRYGPGVCKIDFLLSEPIPWRSESATRTATVHVAQDYRQIADAETAVAHGEHPRRPWLLCGEPTRLDPLRAEGSAGGETTSAGGGRAHSTRHVAWAYCHVPNGSSRDMGEAMIDELERCAPGFRDVVVASRVQTAAQLGEHDANFVGGDIGCGATSLRQILGRPRFSPNPVRPNPYATGVPGVYLCSSATAPGGGVHGMSGYWAAKFGLAE